MESSVTGLVFIQRRRLPDNSRPLPDYSDFWELDNVTGDTASQVIVDKTKNHFARHGIPDTVLTDNGPQFIAAHYEQFSREWEFEHITSSPYHSQSNGKAEATVKIAKKIIKKTKSEKKDIHLAILDWRNTPSDSGSSPVQRIMSRRTNTLLPMPEGLLKPCVVDGVSDQIKLRKQKAKLHYDKGTQPLPELQIG
jgi:transposase InsO family protein